jgi:hypothetical protein
MLDMTEISHESPLEQQALSVIEGARELADENSRLTIKQAYHAAVGNQAELHLIANTDSAADGMGSSQYAYLSADIDGRYTTIFSLDIHSILSTGTVKGMLDGVVFLMKTRIATPTGTLERGLLESMSSAVVIRRQKMPFTSQVRLKLASRFNELLGQGDCLRTYSSQQKLPDNFLLGVNVSELDGNGKHLSMADSGVPAVRVTLGRNGLHQQIVLEQDREGVCTTYHEPVDISDRASAYGLPKTRENIDPASGPVVGNLDFMQLYAASDRANGKRELNEEMLSMLERQVKMARLIRAQR